MIKRVFIFIVLLVTFSYANSFKIVSNNDKYIPADVGDTVRYFIILTSDSVYYNGLSIYLSIKPSQVEVLDQNYNVSGKQPFLEEDVFSDYTLLANQIIDDTILSYSIGMINDSFYAISDTLCSFKVKILKRNQKTININLLNNDTYKTGLSRTTGEINNQVDAYIQSIAILPYKVGDFYAVDVAPDSGGVIKIYYSYLYKDFVDGFRLYRREKGSNDDFTLIYDFPKDEAFYYDSVEVNKYYEYYIYAYNEYIQSEPSDTIVVMGLDNRPSKFDLIAPEDNSMLREDYSKIGYNFIWNKSIDPDNREVVYNFKLAFDSLFTAVVCDTFIEDTILNYKLLPLENMKLYWKVSAIDRDNFNISSNQIYRFYINLKEEAPKYFRNLYPIKSEIVTDSIIDFIWQKSIDPDPLDSVEYTFYLYKDKGANIIFKHILSDTSYTLSQALEDDQIYYWRVESKDTKGLINTTLIDSFYLNYNLQAPENFQILSPEYGQRFSQKEIMIRYTRAEDKDLFDSVSYYVIFFREENNNNIDTVITSDTAVMINNLIDNSIYHFKVEAHDKYGLVTIAEPENLIIYIDQYNLTPSSFDLIAPDSAANFKEGEVLFIWNKAIDEDPGDSVLYDFYFSASGDLTTAYKYNIVDTFFVLPVKNLVEDTKYFWTVKAHDKSMSYRTATQSGWFIYKNTENDPPIGFDLLSPSNYSVVNEKNVHFMWNQSIDRDIEDTISYVVFIYDSNFVKIDSSEILYDTSYICKYNFLENKRYYWNVQAFDNHGLSVNSNQNFYIFYYNYIDETPLSFSLISPQNGVKLKNEDILFKWSRSVNTDPGDSVYYKISFSVDKFNTLEFDTIISDTFCIINSEKFISDTTYYWRVQAIDQGDNYRYSDDIFNFYIDTKLPDFSFYIAADRNLRTYLKFFAISDEALGENPVIICNSYDTLNTVAIDTAENIYFSSYHLSSPVNQINIKIQGVDFAGNIGTLEGNYIIFSDTGTIALSKINVFFTVTDRNSKCYIKIDTLSNNRTSFSVNKLDNSPILLKLKSDYNLYYNGIRLSKNGEYYLLKEAGNYVLEKGQSLQLSISIYPNPFNNYFIIDLKNIISNRKYSIYLYNIVGEKVSTIIEDKIFNKSNSIIKYKVKDLSSGVYFLAIFDGTDKIVMKKLLYIK